MRSILILAAPLLLAACAAANAPDSGPVPETPQPVSLRLDLTGRTAPVLGENGAGEVMFLRKGDDAPLAVPFANGGLAETELLPGSYNVTGIGPLRCRGLEFTVDGAAPARALGTIRAEIVATEYIVALMSVDPAAADDVGALAGKAGAAPGAVDDRPLSQREAAPCFVNRGGPDMTWQEVPLHEKIMLGILMAGICAGSVASGGFCAFGAGAVGF